MRFNVENAKFLRSIKDARDRPSPPRPSVAFAGRSNAGKSSLINALTRRKGLAKTSGEPGRTQSIVYFDIDEKLYFVDLPGYGFAKAPEAERKKWRPMVEKFMSSTTDLRLIVLILDARRDPSPDDLALVRWLEHIELPYFFALTKFDKLRPKARVGRVEAVAKILKLGDDSSLLPFSSVTGEGRRELLQVIARAADPSPASPP